VLVSVEDGRVLFVGLVPSQHRPSNAVRPDPGLETELLWAIKGAGTNFGIILSVTFKAYAAPQYRVQHWTTSLALSGPEEAGRKMMAFDNVIASRLPQSLSVDAYLYSEDGERRLGMTLYEPLPPTSRTTNPLANDSTAVKMAMHMLQQELGAEEVGSAHVVDAMGLFDAELYMSKSVKLHGS
jgi:hypothetical protein